MNTEEKDKADRISSRSIGCGTVTDGAWIKIFLYPWPTRITIRLSLVALRLPHARPSQFIPFIVVT